ncbi:Retrovirus-related Pol polyprotein from transposon TNT 1-94, partial [Trametes pubescens]
CSATFAGGQCVILDAHGTTIGRVPKTRGLYVVVREREPPAANTATDTVEELTEDEAHRRFGHIAIRSIRELVANGFITGVKLTKSSKTTPCEACVRAKSTRKPVPDERQGQRAEDLGEEIHSDTWGPARVVTIGGRKYYISFTDDKTRFSTLYLLRSKSEAFDSFKAFEAWLERHHGARICFLNIDRGGEYLSNEFKDYLEQHGIEYKLSVHDTSEEAGVSERLNRTLMEKVRAMLITSGLPRFLWGEAALHATWLKNRSPTKALGGRTPFEAVTGKPPDMRGLPVWGSKVWVHDTSDGKLGERARCGRWVGFDPQSQGSRIYWPSKHTITVERNLRFTDPGLPGDLSDDPVELEGVDESSTDAGDVQDKPAEPSEPLEDDFAPSTVDHSAPLAAELPAAPEPPALAPAPHDDLPMPRRSTRTRTQAAPPAAPLPTLQEKREADDARAVEDLLIEEIGGTAMAAQMAEVEGLDPRSLAEAKRRPEWPRWEEAMEEELTALEAHRTWRLEKPPPGANVVSCRWVFHAKKDASGNVYRYRARLVARGFSQIPGVDFFDTYAPVAKTASIRIALAFAARHDFEVHQVDVKSAYLNGEFEDNEVIWMALPPGSKMTNDKSLALRLLRPLYGLKQSARHWHKKLLRVLREKLNMSQSDVDQAVFFRVKDADLIVIVVHVDDLTVVAATIALIVEVKAKLREAFDISDEGEIHWILAVGSLMYASLGTRPDITYAVSILSRFSDNPGRAHWDAVRRVLRYLNGTKHLKLTYGATTLDLVGYSDADGSMHEDRKAISGYAFLIDGDMVADVLTKALPSPKVKHFAAALGLL